MIQWGDLLRVPYTGRIHGVLRLSLLYGFQFDLVLSSTLYYLLICIYIHQFHVLFSSIGALL